MNTLLEKTINYVDSVFGFKSKHYERTLYWFIELEPKADLACQIAAYSHDIHRAFSREQMFSSIEKSNNGFKDEIAITEHQEVGANIMYKFLTEQGAEQELCNKVKHLISKHEVGGDPEQNLLKDADSVSFFEVNSISFVDKFKDRMGNDKTKEKLEWMYERINLPKAKKIARPMYKKALAHLSQ